MTPFRSFYLWWNARRHRRRAEKREAGTLWAREQLDLGVPAEELLAACDNPWDYSDQFDLGARAAVIGRMLGTEEQNNE